MLAYILATACSYHPGSDKKHRLPEDPHHRQKHVQLARSPKTDCKKDHPEGSEAEQK